MWYWLRDNPTKNKWEWPRWKWNGGDIERASCLCFACEYAYRHFIANCPLCDKCYDYSYTSCLNGLYYKWDTERNLTRRAILAEKIAELPIKEGVKYI